MLFRSRRLPVLDRNQKLVGVVSLGDIAIHNKDTRLSGEILEHVSVPSREREKIRRPAA